jgi:hypothetical protein
VGRTSVEAVGEAVDAINEHLVALGEAVVGEDLAALDEAAVAEADAEERARAACTWRWWVRCRRWTRQTIGEVAGEAPVVDPTVVREATVVQALRQSRSGHVGGGEIIVGRV